MAVQAILMHKLRSFLSTLGVMVAILSVVSLLSVVEGARVEALREIRQLGTQSLVVRWLYGKGEPAAATAALIPRTTLARIEADLRATLGFLELAAPVALVRAAPVARSPLSDVEVLAVTGNYDRARSMTVSRGRFLCDEDIEQGQRVCVLGAQVAGELGVSGQVGQVLRIGGEPYQVVGVLEDRAAPGERAVAMGARDYNRDIMIPLMMAGGAPEDGGLPVTDLLLRVTEGTDLHAAAAAVRSYLETRSWGRGEVQVVIPLELLRQAGRTRRLFGYVLGSIAVISLLVGGVGIANTMLAGVSDRIREIGIRRAVGASRRHIALQFLLEAVLLTLAGGCAGTVLGVVGTAVMEAWTGWVMVITWWSVVAALGLAFAAGTVAGLYPALRAARVDPVEALRHA